MSLCDTCRAPGACCRHFVLSRTWPALAWRSEAAEMMADAGLPFVPVGVVIQSADPNNPSVLFECNWLGKDGRCTNYSERPFACRDYPPGHNPLCAEHVPTIKGIKVVTVT